MSYLRKAGYEGKSVLMGVRPEDIYHVPSSTAIPQKNTFDANISVSELLGSEIIVYSDLEGQEFIARLDSELNIKSGNLMTMTFDMSKVHFFDVITEGRILLPKKELALQG